MRYLVEFPASEISISSTAGRRFTAHMILNNEGFMYERRDIVTAQKQGWYFLLGCYSIMGDEGWEPYITSQGMPHHFLHTYALEVCITRINASIPQICLCIFAFLKIVIC